MIKNLKAYINLASPGDHDYLAPVTFEHGQSECLRIQEIRLRARSGEKPYKLPLNLLTWFTEHAPAGRELTRDDNNQSNEANLYTDITVLKEQIETFALKSPFLLEVEINELDQNDESRARSDQGMLHIEVNLYHGPKANCTLTLSPISANANQLTFPQNCKAQGRFELASTILKSDQGPLDPAFDKRVLICTVDLDEKWQGLRHAIIDRLSLVEAGTEQPATYIRDAHHYAEYFEAYPHDQKMDFPDGVQIFGPLIPSAPKEKRGPWTVCLNAPLNDPFWQQLADLMTENDNQSLKLKLNLILPEPSVNLSEQLDLEIIMDQQDWVIISDGAARAEPVLLPVNRNNSDAPQDQSKNKQANSTANNSESVGELIVPTTQLSLPASEFLSIQYYAPLLKSTCFDKGPVNIALTPAKQDASFYTVKPEVSEITNCQRHMLLLNRIALNKKLKYQKADFKLRCFWPEQQITESFTLTIRLDEQVKGKSLAIDFGSKSISMATLQENSPKLISLGDQAPRTYLTPEFLPSEVTFSGRRHNKEAEDKGVIEQNWHAQSHPLSISFQQLPWQEGALENRLATEFRTYDIALPGNEHATHATRVNLKRLFSQSQNRDEGDANYLLVSRAIKNKSNPVTNEAQAPVTGLTTIVNPTYLMRDCLDELYNFYGTYLQKSEPDLNAETAGTQLTTASEIILTHTTHLSSLAANRFKDAGANALARYEQGSFYALGSTAELLGLQGKDDLKSQVHLLSETVAAAYHCLKSHADQEQPARSKKIQQIHMDIGASHVGLSAQSGWIGETNATIEIIHSAIDLPLGGRSLELALTKEINTYLSTALQANDQITRYQIVKRFDLPNTIDDIRAADQPADEQQQSHQNFLTSLRAALHELPTTKMKAGNNLKICLAAFENEESKSGEKRSAPKGKSPKSIWPFTFARTEALPDQPVILWHGLRGEQLVLIPQETLSSTAEPNKSSTGWRVELHLELDTIAQKVGPLSAYMAFVAEFLPRAIEHTFPALKKGERADRYFSLTGGISLFAPLRTLIETTANKLGFHLLPLAQTYKQAKAATALGAASLIKNQSRAPYQLLNPNLILVPLTDQTQEASHQVHGTEGESMITAAKNGNLVIIKEETASGTLPANCTTLQLIETIAGFGSLLSKAPDALYCQTYLDDLDRATVDQWNIAAIEWQSWLNLCFQTMLNMPIASPANSQEQEEKATSQNIPLNWTYKALKQDEASLTIGEHAYWVSSGLTTSST